MVDRNAAIRGSVRADDESQARIADRAAAVFLLANGTRPVS